MDRPRDLSRAKIARKERMINLLTKTLSKVHLFFNSDRAKLKSIQFFCTSSCAPVLCRWSNCVLRQTHTHINHSSLPISSHYFIILCNTKHITSKHQRWIDILTITIWFKTWRLCYLQCLQTGITSGAVRLLQSILILCFLVGLSQSLCLWFFLVHL